MRRRRRADSAQARLPSRLRRARGCGGFRCRRAEGGARTRASRRDVLRRATPDITGLRGVAARLFSAASPGRGWRGVRGSCSRRQRRPAADDDPVGRSRRFRFAASPATGDAGPWLPSPRPSLPRRPRGCSSPEAVTRPRAARPLPHVKQVGPGPRPAPGFCCGPSGLGGAQ